MVAKAFFTGAQTQKQPVFTDGWMAEQTVVYTHSGILRSLKKEGTSAMCYMDKLWGHQGILNPLSQAGDWTWVTALQRCRRFHCATVGTPLTPFVEETVLPSLGSLGTLVEGHLTIYMRAYFWVFILFHWCLCLLYVSTVLFNNCLVTTAL